MLDSDLAVLYEVEVKQLNEAVKRNIKRFDDEGPSGCIICTEMYGNGKYQCVLQSPELNVSGIFPEILL